MTYGADVLRLFVGALDFGGDMACPGDSEEQQQSRHTVVHAASTTYIKLRNAFRYLIGSLQDFDINAVSNRWSCASGMRDVAAPSRADETSISLMQVVLLLVRWQHKKQKWLQLSLQESHHHQQQNYLH